MNPTALESTAAKPRKKPTDKGTVEKLRKPLYISSLEEVLWFLVAPIAVDIVWSVINQ